MSSCVSRLLGLVAITASAQLGCAGAPPPAPSAAELGEDPTPLTQPEQLSPDFSVRQHLEASAQGKSGAFDAVVQKRAGELLVVGLGPAGVRMFVLRQVGAEVSFEQSFGPKLPFDPRNIVLDIQRVYYKGLPDTGARDGSFEADTEDGHVREIWREGQLRERQFSREGRRGAIIVSYGPGCARGRCAPEYVTLDNSWYGYVLRITNRDYHFFEEAAP